MAEQRLTLRPALNPLKQRAGLVPVRLAGRLGGIQMDMRLNKGGIASPPRAFNTS
jgi:hypothetical protein